MGSRRDIWLPGVLLAALAAGAAQAQVFVVGEATATQGLATEFHPTDIKLETEKLTERGRRQLIRDFEAEQGFAYRALPLGGTLTLMANGPLKPSGDAYRALIYEKGTSVVPGERVAITKLKIEHDRIVFDLNGGPKPPHDLLRHIQINGAQTPGDPLATAAGSRLTLVFDKFVPDITGDEVKALIGGVIDFNARTGERAYAETLPPKVRDAVKAHEPLVGMDRKMVLAALGQPVNKVREPAEGDAPEYEDWIYGTPPSTVRFVRIIGDRVVRIEVAERGKPILVRDRDETDGEVPPQDTQIVAFGDAAPGAAADSAAKAPPTLREPGDPEIQGTMRKVQFPNQQPDGTSAGSSTQPQTQTQTQKPPSPPMTENTGVGKPGSGPPSAPPADPSQPTQ